MKRVLIVSYLFEPQNAIGAVRPSKLAKYLSADGYSVDVFTTSEGLNCMGAQNKTYRIIYDNPINAKSETAKASAPQSDGAKKKVDSALVHEIKMAYRQMGVLRQGFAFRKKLVEAIREQRISIDDYDCVFTTFGPVGSLLCGMMLKSMKPGIRWINDFRDPMVSDIMPKLFAPYYGYLQNKSISKCDIITTVSHGYKKRMIKKRYEDKCVVIPNGYDDADTSFDQEIQDDGLLTFAYVGALYEGKRDLGELFSMLYSLIESGEIEKEKVKFHYAGGSYEFLMLQAEKYHMEDIIINHGVVSRKESLMIQRQAKILVLSTWNDKGEEGVFPGKLIEYMQMKKPIFSVVNGELPGSEVSETIAKYSLGVSFEEADPASRKNAMAWLEASIRQYNKTGMIPFEGDVARVDKQYNWKNIVKRFEKMMA